MVKFVIKEAVNLCDESTSDLLVKPRYRWKISTTSSSLSSDRVIKGKWTKSNKVSKNNSYECQFSINKSNAYWNASNDNVAIDLGEDMDATVTLHLKRRVLVNTKVGETSFTVGDLVQMCHGKETVELMLFHRDTENLVAAGTHGGDPSIVRVGIARNKKDTSGSATGTSSSREPYNKRVMIVTRGTLGDVQPFLALARGLADLQNCDVIFVTELEFKGTILKNHMSAGENGRISFRPSGGNTMKKVNQASSQFAINYKIAAPQTNVMQSLFLSRTEVEFFSSEPAVHYWAEHLKPDLLIYGFTMTAVSMIISESLKIPLVGFLLQPTCIPSTQYPPCLPLLEKNYRKLTESAIAKKHKSSTFLKHIMDNGAVLGDSMASMRRRRDLKHFGSTNVYQELRDKNYPLIVPVNETMFGGKPKDWSEKSVFTDCIFLRGGKVPPIKSDAQAFLDGAKSMKGGKVVILAFSSMPVTKSQIVSIAMKLIHECSEPNKVCVFALVNGKELDIPLHSKTLEADSQKARSDGRLFLASRAPFGRLFPLVDAVVLHGGLGTTSEVLQAQIPAIVTGVLLLDQRYWGMRCCELGVGPFGSHIDDFPKHCVEYVDKALRDGSEWKQNAEKVGALMAKEAKEDPSGVQRNVDCVMEMAKDAKPYWFTPDEAFCAYDYNHDGELSLDEITSLCESLSLSMDEAEINDMFEKADSDRNGSINIAEFRSNMYQTLMEHVEE